MVVLLKKLIGRKVTLSDIAAPSPSFGAKIVISGAMKEAFRAQESVTKEAAKIQYSKS